MSALLSVPAGTPAPTQAQIRDALLRHLQQQILAQAAGEHIPAATVLTDTPQERHWLGQLASEPQLTVDAARGFSPRLVPAAQGFSFPVHGTGPVHLDVQLSFAVYVALHPTAAEQREFVHAGDDDSRSTSGSAQGRHLARVWTKVLVGPLTVPITVAADDTSRRFAAAEITTAVTDAVAAAARAAGGRDLYRAKRTGTPRALLPVDADFVDDTSWASYAGANLLPAADVTAPQFAAAIEVDATVTQHGRELLVTVINTSPADDAQFADLTGSTPLDRDHLDSRLYEVQLAATTDAPVDVYTLEQVARSHRYDRTVEAFGQACPVEVDPLPGGQTRLRTVYGAVNTTGRSHPTDAVDTSFTAFISDPVAAAGALVEAHEQWVTEHWSTAALDRRHAAGAWTPEQRAAADTEADAAHAEVAWLRAGLDALRGDPMLRRAFVLMNTAMERVAAAKNFKAWFPFQIAWILGCLPAVADPTADLAVQILTVPPGGGKSEAYNGVALVHLFYARMRGDLRGVTVWARFPLRLLSAQQTERFAAAVFAAELVRLDQADLRAGDPFGIGFFVGSGTTPNKYWPADVAWARGVDPFDPAEAERCRVLEHCPVCDPAGAGPRLVVRFDGPSWTMQHLCANRSCSLGGQLPLWVVDDDIYRQAPSVLVGTVDKLAQVAHSDKFKILFGRALGRCAEHGWTVDPARCGVYRCNEPRLPVGEGFGHLRCEITDELHLLDESLGALDGMYETLVQQIGADLGNTPLHILAATATIEGYQTQVQHLYRRTARRFPEPGPSAAANFFSAVDPDEPLRRHLGVRPRGTTMVTASADVTRVHRDWLTTALADPAAAATAAGLDAIGQARDGVPVVDVVTRAVRHDYEVLLAYCLRNEDMAAYASDDRVADVATTTEQRAVISGDADAVDIRAAVDRLNKPPADAERRTRLIVATKAIGHGFDSPRLGVMVLMGTPTQAAEVIQATARVGRTHPGLVVHVFNPSRDRDSSVFRWYAKWVDYLDRLLTKVPVNRESLPVLRRALPGALMARLLQIHDPAWMTSGRGRYSLGDAGQVRDALAAGFLTDAQLITELSAGLGLEAANPYHQMHHAEVAEFVSNTLVRLPVATGGGRTRTADQLRPGVPRSLRDIEEPITITGNL
ncbi:helicase-related protein [Geodermatophilus sabuli]|uniref:Helicase conserved C-terminal domain-containing protein n=1 Tax=Geodermatophilus sabuli TaxID=1564158 RepID=A0A285EBX8_9ACTN|nr:helicase-related protein [Geodermatophilus sabuli]MBB3084182.1 hypothetical protein [Geodermatophilus sabuli]SNX96545.1 Helicase conserved C-terminal domain-containing protein [Geodermatophilus sabuli]